MDRALFKFAHQLRVRSYEVDWQGIVHNSNYIRYGEVGRIEYLRHLGSTIDMHSINNDARVVLVRNEIDYLAPARYDDVLSVLSRVSAIRDTSFIMESVIEVAASGQRVAENVAYHAWLHPDRNESIRVPDEFRELIRRFEGPDCQMGAASIR